MSITVHDLVTEGGVRRLALTVPDAATVSGTSRDTLERAQRRGELEFRYPTSKPVILVDELLEFLKHLPTSRP